MSPKHQKVQTEPHSKRQCTVVSMSHIGTLILPVALDITGKGAKHTDECEVESLTGPTSFVPLGCSA